MFKKKVAIFSLIILVFLIVPFSFATDIDDNQTLISSDEPTDLNTIYVDSAIGNDNANGSSEAPVKTINQAITLSENGGIIKLNGTFKGSGNTEITINKNKANNLTFIGTGDNTVINGMGGSSLFSITSGNASFINLTLFNAFKKGRGAAISITSGENLYVNNVTFNSNIVDYSPKGYSGGAIYVSKGKLYVYNSTFIKNQVKQTFYGGAIYLKDGAEGFIYNSNFSNNSAFLGGAIYASTDCSISVEGSIFYANNVYGNGATTRYGGAIYSNKYMTVSNSYFVSNLACGGGALYSPLDDEEAIVVTNSTFYYNVAADGNGGAILAIGGVNVKDSKFVENDAFGSRDYLGFGGAIYGYDVDVNYTVFTNNSAKEGSAVAGNGSLNVSYSSLVDNSPSFVYSPSDNADINYNWWGENDPQVSTSVKAVLEVSCNENPILENYDVLINTDLYWEGTNTRANVPRGNITLKSNGGSLNNSKFSSDTAGSYIISASLNNEVQYLTVNVQSADLIFLYVSKDGNDSNEGSINDPLLTLNKAIEIANSNYNTVIYISNGTYDENALTINRNTTIYGGNAVVNLNNLNVNRNLNLSDLVMDNINIINRGNLVIDNLTLTNCNIINGGDLNITKSVLDNVAFDNQGNGVITYSSILNSNVINPSNADYNWWGSNVPPLNVNSYVVLNLTSDKNSVIKNETAEIYVNLYWNGTSDKTTGIRYNKVKLTSEGVLDSTEGDIVDSSFETEFHADKWDTYNITASLDDEKQNISITVKRMDLETLYVAKYGDDDNEGTFDSPLLTITKALEIANSNPVVEKIQVYAGTYDDGDLEINSDVVITGGDGVILLSDISNLGEAKLSHFALNASNILNNGTLTLSGCDLLDNQITNNGTLDITGSYIKDCEVMGTADIYYNSIDNLKWEDATVDYNWWLSNTAPSNVDVYAVLNVTANPSEIRSRESSNIYARLYWNGTDDQIGIRNIPQRTIILSSDGGVIGTLEDNFTSYFTTTFKADLPNHYNITVTVDDEIQIITIIIVPESNLTEVYANSSTGSDISGDGSATNPVKTIKRAIEIAADNATIYLTGEFKGEGNIEIELDSTTSHDLTFVGIDDAVVDGEYKHWLFEITNGNAAFVNISLDNAYKEGFGGAIYIHPKYNLTLTNVFARDNYVTNGGCGAVVYGGNIDIEGGEFTNNRASIRGGAIVSIGHINMNGSSFIKNTVNTEGAAIYASTVNITDSVFSWNVVHGSGGAIFLSATVKSSSIDNTLFESNKATQEYGGAISTKAILLVTNSQFDGNVAYGSAAIDNSGNLTVIDCIFVKNNATDRDAGAVSNLGNAQIINSTFIDNVAFRNGGAIKNQGYNLTVENCGFTGNAANGDDSGSYGGAIYAWMADTYVFNSTFKNNYAPDKGGAIYASQGNVGEATLVGYFCDFLNNTAQFGGALLIETPDGKFTNSAFVNSSVCSNYDFDINSNWWGESSPDWSEVLQGYIAEPNVYAVLNHIVDPEDIPLGNSSHLLFNLFWNDADERAVIPTRYISLTAKGGVLSKTEGNLDKEFATTFKLMDTDNLVQAFVDNEVFEHVFGSRENSSLSVSANNITVGDILKINISSNPLFDANLTVFVGDKEYSASLINGAADLNVSDLKSGEYVVLAIFRGDDHYKKSNATTTVFVSKVSDYEMSSNISDVKEGEDVNIMISLPGDASGSVSVIIGDNSYYANVKNGSASVSISNLNKGNYNVSINYRGDEKYAPKSINDTFTVNESSGLVITALDVEKYYKGPERFVVHVSYNDEALVGANVSITINAVTYNRITDVNGNTSIPLGINSGTYIVTTKVKDASVNSTVVIKETVNGTDVVKVFKNDTQYYATFRDSEGNYLAEGTEVQFNINGVLYTRTVKENGLAKLNINLAQGSYIITAINNVTGEKAANNITVISRIADNKDLVKYYRNASQYVVTLLGNDGKAVGAGEVVTFNINGVFYNRTTNASGQAKLNINLQSGNYIITAEYKGCKVSNNIEVKPVLSAQDLKMSYRDGSRFEAKLVDGKGNPFKGESISFNINGVFYSRVTDGDGIARLNINLMRGEYIITSSYNGSNIANTIMIS